MGKRQLGALVTALALTAAGCGGSPDEGSGGSDGASVKGKKGGGVTFLAAADVDYLDPGQSYYTFGYAVIYATQRPLYSFKPDEPEKPGSNSHFTRRPVPLTPTPSCPPPPDAAAAERSCKP